jgi:hypothetical protein
VAIGQRPGERGADWWLAEEAAEACHDGRFQRFDQHIASALLRPRLNFCEPTVFETFKPDRSEAGSGAAVTGEWQGGDVCAAVLQLLPCLAAGQLAGAWDANQGVSVRLCGRTRTTGAND